MASTSRAVSRQKSGTSQPADLAQLRAKLARSTWVKSHFKPLRSPNQVLIRVQRQEGGEEAQTAAVNKMREAVTELDPGVKIERTEVVGPKVSGELSPVRA